MNHTKRKIKVALFSKVAISFDGSVMGKIDNLTKVTRKDPYTYNELDHEKKVKERNDLFLELAYEER